MVKKYTQESLRRALKRAKTDKEKQKAIGEFYIYGEAKDEITRLSNIRYGMRVLGLTT